MQRRRFLEGLAGSVLLALAACTAEVTRPVAAARRTPPAPAPASHPRPVRASTPAVPARLFHPPAGLVRAPIPDGTITMLPGPGNLLALTVDDGTDTEVVHAYARLAVRTGLRLTFFANGYLPSWTEHAPVLRRLVDADQALIANHTWSHPNLNRLSDAEIAEEITHNEHFLWDTYGVDGRPFLRPPYGFHGERVDRIVRELGYPGIAMWYGSLGDSTELAPAQIMDNARQWLQPGHLVIGHANHRPVLEVLDQIVDLIHSRGLQPVHLGDVYSTSGH